MKFLLTLVYDTFSLISFPLTLQKGLTPETLRCQKYIQNKFPITLLTNPPLRKAALDQDGEPFIYGEFVRTIYTEFIEVQC